MTRLRARFPSLYRFAALLALLGMFVPVATGLVHQPAAIQYFVHICRFHHSDDTGKTPVQKLPSCPICQSMHQLGNGFVPPLPPVVLAILVAFIAVFALAYRMAFTRREVAPQARPRAPPSFV